MSLAIVSVLIMALSIGGCYVAGVCLWFALALATLLHVPLAWGVFHPAPSWVCPTITHGRRGAIRRIALTFDDGPCPSVTPEVLRTLAERGVAATFFCIGKAARRHPLLLRAIADAGHEIGNHSFLHPRHVYLWNAETLLRDATLAQRAIERAGGRRSTLYRPPVGFRSPAMAKVMRRMGLCLVNFDARAYDTGKVDARVILDRLLRKVRPGSIILLHDGSDVGEAPDRSAMLEALPTLIEELRRRDYRFVTVSALLGM